MNSKFIFYSIRFPNVRTYELMHCSLPTKLMNSISFLFSSLCSFSFLLRHFILHQTVTFLYTMTYEWLARLELYIYIYLFFLTKFRIPSHNALHVTSLCRHFSRWRCKSLCVAVSRAVLAAERLWGELKVYVCSVCSVCL